MAVPTGTDVFAAKDGEVTEVVRGYPVGDRTTYNGNYVRIQYDDDTLGTYIHLETATVEVGWSIQAGDKIGTSNDTGKSLGPHLHYTLYTDETRDDTLDPTLEFPNCFTP